MIQSAKSSFEKLTAMAAAIFDAPLSVVTLLDEERAVIRGQSGLDIVILPRDESMGARLAELGPGGLIFIPDTTKDPRGCDHAMVTKAPFVR